MSNIAGKTSAINVVTPVSHGGFIVRIIFRIAQTRFFRSRLRGLETLSLIHYAQWTVVGKKSFPRLSPEQPKEKLKYGYQFFFSNFNGSWDQYIDSFAMSLAKGLDLLWFQSVLYPKSVPINAFHRYINANQIRTLHYYNAYPLATSNDVKAAQRVKASLTELANGVGGMSDDAFAKAYAKTVLELQNDLSQMERSPIVSLANQAVDERVHAEEAGY